MELEKLTAFAKRRDELLNDSVALEAWLNYAFSEEFVFKIEDAIVNGTGSGCRWIFERAVTSRQQRSEPGNPDHRRGKHPQDVGPHAGRLPTTRLAV